MRRTGAPSLATALTAFASTKTVWTRAEPAVSASLAAFTVSLGVTTIVALVLLDVPVATRVVALPVFLVGAAVIFGLGLSDFARGHERLFALALIAGGLLWSLSALSASRDPVLYSAGRMSQWLVYLTVVYLLLSYPSGRLPDTAGRRVFTGAALLVGLLFLPTALLAQHFPAPAPWSPCSANCPANAFSIGPGAQPSGVVVALREGLVPLLFAAVALVVLRRRRQMPASLKDMYSPMVWAAVLIGAGFAVYFPLRGVNPGSQLLPPLGWSILLALPLVALAAALGRVNRRSHVVGTLARMARELSSGPSPAQIRQALGEILHDSSLEICHSFPSDAGAWLDETGSPVTLSEFAADREITEVANGGWRVAIVHDHALGGDPALVSAAASYALAALESDRLKEQLRTSIANLAEARARGVSAEDRERRKIERDLHDGAQQRLIGVRIKLGAAAGRFDESDPSGAAVIRALSQDIDATIDDVRAFAAGIYPPMLDRTGLRDALLGMSRGAAVPAIVHAEDLRRYPQEIEKSVYFSCSEGLQNAAKHARGVTNVLISVWEEGGRLKFAINDDGCGFDVQATPCGTGLGSLQDRLAVVGGTLTIRSAAGCGTTLMGSIPLS